MQKRQSVLAVGVSVGLLGLLTMASGCVAPPENAEPASESASDGEMETVSQAANSTASCAYAANGQGDAGKKEAQKRSLQAIKYVLGGANISGCTSFKTQADVIRAAFASQALKITTTSATTICGIPAKRIRVTEQTPQSTRTSGPLWDAIHAMVPPDGQGGIADSCFGIGASTFFVLQTGGDYNATTKKYTNWVEFDPSPATLTANLTGATSTSAAAKYSDNSTTSIYRWATTGGSCGTGHAGLTCSTATANSGTTHYKSLVHDDGSCYCQ